MSSLEYNLKLDAMRSEWKHAQNLAASLQQELIAARLQMAELQADNQMLQKKLSDDETLLSSGASVLAALLWKASDSPRTIKELLKARSKLSSLFKFFSGRLASCCNFSAVFNLGKEDADLIHSLGGFLVNLLVSRQGCDVILCDESGQVLLSKIIHILHRLDETPPQTQTDGYGKAIFLMILYNTSLEPAGAELLKQYTSLVEALCRDFLQSGDKQIKVLEIRILDSMLSQNDPNVTQIIRTMLPTEKLIAFAQEISHDKEASSLIKGVAECLKELAELCAIEEVLKCRQDALEQELEAEIDEEYIAELLGGTKPNPLHPGASIDGSTLCFDLVNVK